MAHKCFRSAIAVVLLLVSTPLMAGGPPWLSLPVEGVNPANADATAKALTSKLKNKLWQTGDVSRDVRLQQRSNQWYVMFYIANDVRLQDVETALAGSGLTIPRDKLHLFGHVILEIESVANAKELLSDLEKLNSVSVVQDESKQEENRLVVTLELPYPTEFGRPEAKAASWDKFELGKFESSSANPKGVATAETLPSYPGFAEIIARHHAKLRDIRWSTNYGCRPLGGVAAPTTVRSATVSLLRTK